jgi:helicase
LKLATLPIPASLAELLEGQGYVDLYPPQADAISAGVLDGRSLLLSTPTASGKTLVAILAAANLVLANRGKVVYLTPLRALANEKFEEFRSLEALRKTDGEPVRVSIGTGDYDASGEELGQADILVLTNEKFDSVLRHGVSWLERVRLFVADEVHLVGNYDRGPTIEAILTKIRTYLAAAQVLALSATITNAADLGKWLAASPVDVQWRPVPLREGVHQHGAIRFNDGERRAVASTGRGNAIDAAIDILNDGGQALIFAETRKRSVSLAGRAAEMTPRFLTDGERQQAFAGAQTVLREAEETELSRSLARALERGAAFHHAGLAPAHRRVVEDLFRAHVIKVLVATPTLAAGVNLPARRVVIASLMRYDAEVGGSAPISVLDYKQMCGRAGRPRYDSIGETVLLANSEPEAEELVYQYIQGSVEPVRSQFAQEGALRTHVLALISSLPGLTEEEVQQFFGRTLFAAQYRRTLVETKVRAGLEYLVAEDLLMQRGRRYAATEFGRRVSMLYIEPATAVLFRQALRSPASVGEHSVGLLHLVVAAPDFAPRFPLRSRDWDGALAFLNDHQAEFLLPLPGQREYERFEAYVRDLRAVMILAAWIEETHEDRLLEMLGAEPGDLHRAVENVDWLLYSLSELARLLGRAELLPEMQMLRTRARYGVKTELLPLVRLAGIGRVRARALFRAGFTGADKIAAASVERLASVPKIGPTLARQLKEQLR